MAAGRFRKSVERLGKQIVRILKLAALDAFPNPALDFRLVNFDAHGFPAIIVSQKTLREKPLCDQSRLPDREAIKGPASVCKRLSQEG